METKFAAAAEAPSDFPFAAAMPQAAPQQRAQVRVGWAAQTILLVLLGQLALAGLALFLVDGAMRVAARESLQQYPVLGPLLLCAAGVLFWLLARAVVGAARSGRVREARLATENALFGAMLRCSPAAQLVYGLDDGRLRYANDAACHMLGWSHFRHDQRARDILGMTDDSARAANLRQVLQSDRPFQDLEIRLRRPRGGFLDVLAMGGPLTVNGGRCMLLQFIDCSDRKRREEELLRSRDSFRSVFQNGPNPCSMTSLKGGVFIEVNEAWLALFGYRRDEVVGRSVDELRLWDDAGQRSDLQARLLETGSLRGVECRHLSKDGVEIDVLLSAEVIDVGGEKQLLSQAADITDRKRFERALQRLNTELENRVEQRTLDLSELNSQLESFSYSIAHDLRAPLRAIDGFTILLAQEHAQSLDEGGRLYLGKVQANVARMTALINDLLAFAKAGRGEIDCSSVDIGRLASDVAAELAPANPRAEIQVDALPLAHANPSLLRQVLHNLVANALKFSRDNPAARVRIGSQVQDGNVVYFVKDNGVGFDMRYAGKLFGVFQRLHGSKEFDGTGVGLAIAARIVQRHGGRIWADAAVGAGATFFFQLPPAADPAPGAARRGELRN